MLRRQTGKASTTKGARTTRQSRCRASGGKVPGASRGEARDLFETQYLQAQLLRFGGNISRTASFVGMERSALHRKLKQLGIGSETERGGG